MEGDERGREEERGEGNERASGKMQKVRRSMSKARQESANDVGEKENGRGI